MAKTINFSCPKCASGRETTGIRYRTVNDYLECTCSVCGYEWRLEPADRDIEPPIPPDDSDVKEQD